MTVSTRFLINQIPIMKKILSFAILAAVIFFTGSCNKEDVLEPTNIEKDWAKNIDLSNAYVKQLYEETGVAILTEYDDTLDVFYQGSDYGVVNGVALTHIESEKKDKAIEWLKTNILDCFSTDCIKTYFPRRIFLCNTLKISGSAPGNVGSWIMELKYANNLWGASGSQHIFPFEQGTAIVVNVDELYNTETQIDYNKQYRTDIMTLLCHELFMKNDWLKGIESNLDIFPDDVTMLYGCNVLDTESTNSLNSSQKYVTAKGMYRLWYGCNAKDSRYGDPITKYDYTKMSLEGYFEFGFPDNGQSDNQAYGVGYFRWPTGTPYTWTSTYYDDYATTKEKLTLSSDGYITISYNESKAPNGSYRDARNLIFALIDLNSTKLSVYGEFLISRLYAMSEYLKGYGIDFQKFNSSVSDMYDMHE